MNENSNFRKYNKPTIEFVELRIEERLARCVDDPPTHVENPDWFNGSEGHGEGIPGYHPGCKYLCAHS